MTTPLSGRGLWYGGGETWNESTWNAACAQAAAWKVQVVHPKVADGGKLWYTESDLAMLTRIAHAHGLVCAPYHFCYGNTYGALAEEASITVLIGKTCGVVCPDMEDAWEGADGAAWAIQYGKLVRASYKGPVIPTTYANMVDHPEPWAELNQWVDGFLPQVYFSAWGNGTAQNAVSFVYPQWQATDTTVHARTGSGLKPLYPIISLDNVRMVEVTAWLEMMGSYGYCGFWWHADYPVYASTIQNAPLPGQHVLSPVRTSTPPLPTASKGVQSEEKKAAAAAVPFGMPESARYQLTDNQLRVLWVKHVSDLPWDNTNPMQIAWMAYIRTWQPIGVPTEKEQEKHIGNSVVRELPLSSGRSLLFFVHDDVIVLV